jgi:hypothetical protein
LLLPRALGAGLGLRRLPVAALVAVLALVAPVVAPRAFVLALLVARLVAALPVRVLSVLVRLGLLTAWRL